MVAAPWADLEGVGLAEVPSSVDLEDVSSAVVQVSAEAEAVCRIHTCVCAFGIVVARHLYDDSTPSNACRTDCRSLGDIRSSSSDTAS